MLLYTRGNIHTFGSSFENKLDANIEVLLLHHTGNTAAKRLTFEGQLDLQFGSYHLPDLFP